LLDLNTKSNKMKNKPAWLETLWNVNPGLAEKAEKDLKNNWTKKEENENETTSGDGWFDLLFS